MESSQKLKYSEYLRLVISTLKSEHKKYKTDKYICNILILIKDQDEYRHKLEATIQKKLHTYAKKHGHSEIITLSTVFDDFDGIETRVKWLETLAKYYESKGR